MHVLREQAVRADDDVDLARPCSPRRVSSCSFFVWKRDSAAHRDRVARHARLEGAEVLLREHRRRAEDRDLLAGHGDAERRADRDLGLAEADVAADEAVHRPRGLEVLVHVVDGARLVGRLVEGERRLEGAVVVVGRREGLAARRRWRSA